MVGLPHVVYEGEQLFDLTYDSMLEEYENRISIQTNYSIDIDVTRNGTTVNASINTDQIGAPDPETKVLHLVLTESHIPENWYGGEEVNHVERLMIPDQHGTQFMSGIYNIEFEMDPNWLVQHCELVAFIQDSISKEIMQSQVFSLSSTVLFTDAVLNEIANPGDDYCNETIAPIIEIENYGADTLMNCIINYELNGIPGEYTWEGSLSTYQTELITLPELSFILQDENLIQVEISQPNGQDDENPENNSLEKSFGISPLIEQPPLQLELKTDDNGNETSWEIINNVGEVVLSGSGYDNNTLYTIDLDIESSGCYSFIIYDQGGNGICCETGAGFYRISDNNGLVYFIGGNFESQDIAMFQLDIETLRSEISLDKEVMIYPNPVKDKLYIENGSSTTIRIYDELYNMLMKKKINSNPYIIDLTFLETGIYFFHIEKETSIEVRKVVVIK